MTIKNYLKAGDEVTIDIDGAKNTLKGFGISSYVGDAAAKEKSPVTASIGYGALPDGTDLPGQGIARDQLAEALGGHPEQRVQEAGLGTPGDPETPESFRMKEHEA